MSQAETTVDRLDVIAVGPHPDDLEITCGGTLALLVKQGYKVGILDLTSGEPDSNLFKVPDGYVVNDQRKNPRISH